MTLLNGRRHARFFPFTVDESISMHCYISSKELFSSVACEAKLEGNPINRLILGGKCNKSLFVCAIFSVFIFNVALKSEQCKATDATVAQHGNVSARQCLSKTASQQSSVSALRRLSTAASQHSCVSA